MASTGVVANRYAVRSASSILRCCLSTGILPSLDRFIRGTMILATVKFPRYRTGRPAACRVA